MDTSITRPSYCFLRKTQREPINGQHALRLYNYAPGLAMLQVRGVNSYHGVTLTRDDLKELQLVIAGAVEDMVTNEVEA